MGRTPWQDRHKLVPAVYVLFERGGKVLLLRRANTGYSDGMYGCPSGHLDGSETATEAACREALEEVGIAFKPSDMQCVHVAHRMAEEGDHERVDFYFRVTKWVGEPVNKEPHKCDELRWAAYDDLPDAIIPTFRQAILAAHRGEFYSEDFPGRAV